MRIALCQINPTVGSISKNADKIIFHSKNARTSFNCDIAFLPELCLYGYPPKDLLFNTDLLNSLSNNLKKISENVPIPTVIGSAWPIDNYGENFINAAIYCFQGQYKVISGKTLLPNYEVFDDRRYFVSPTKDAYANYFEFNGTKIGVCICEDAWNDKSFWIQQKYKEDPVEDLAKKNVDLIVNLSASPFYKEKPPLREQMFSHTAKRLQKPILVCGQVGANDELIFDGHSLAINSSGEVATRSNSFIEDTVVVDYSDNQLTSISKNETQYDNCQSQIEALALGIKDYVSKCGHKRVIIGLSGGIDSSFCAALAVKALGSDNVIGVRMPSKISSEHSLADAQLLANNLNISCLTIPIEETVEQILQQINCNLNNLTNTPIKQYSLTHQNLQARARGVTLMALSNELGGLVLATSNKSELAVGYSTLYGDMCGALAPLADIYKTDLYQLAKHFNLKQEIIPNSIINKAPSAELKPGQFDNNELPDYHILDKILKYYIDENLSITEIIQKTSCTQEEIEKIISLLKKSEYKRVQSAYALCLSPKVFGLGRRWPVAINF